MELTLGPQLWVDWDGSRAEPDADAVRAVEDDPLGRPGGGLWTSSFVDGSSAYVERMREVFPPELGEWHERAAWVLEPRPAHLLVVEDRSAEADFLLLANGPGAPSTWPKVAAGFDGVHMSTQGALSFWRRPAPSEPRWLERMGVMEVLMKLGYGTPLDWWEAESTIWFDWRFSVRRRIADIAVPAIPHEEARDRSPEDPSAPVRALPGAEALTTAGRA
jgi:hypothetical protein